MKRILIGAFTVITLLQTATLSAQTKKGLFFSLNTGYNFKTSTATGIISNITNQQATAKQENINLSLGKGLNFGGSVGYMFNKNIGTELGINYLIGDKTAYTGSSFNASIYESNISGRMLQFKPTLIIALGMEKIDPYAKFGLLIGSGKIKNEEVGRSSTGNSTYKSTYNGGVAFGFDSAIGLLFTLNPKVSLFTELNMVNTSYAPTKGKITEATINGVDQLPNISTNIEFYDTYGGNSESNQDPKTPTRALKTKYPFGSFGFNFGVKYSL
jgi:hypothetical protein